MTQTKMFKESAPVISEIVTRLEVIDELMDTIEWLLDTPDMNLGGLEDETKKAIEWANQLRDYVKDVFLKA